MGVLALGVVDLAGVVTLGLGHPAERVLLRLLVVVGPALAGTLDLRLLTATLVGHSNHHTFVSLRFPASHPTTVVVRLF